MTLVNFTEQGVRAAKDSTKRLAAVRELVKKHGVTMTDAYYTMGKYDMVVIFDAPNAEGVDFNLLKDQVKCQKRFGRAAAIFAKKRLILVTAHRRENRVDRQASIPGLGNRSDEVPVLPAYLSWRRLLVVRRCACQQQPKQGDRDSAEAHFYFPRFSM